jgi:hypothetical protein
VNDARAGVRYARAYAHRGGDAAPDVA